MPVEIKILGVADEHLLTNAEPGVFGHPVDPLRRKEFLSDPRHHMAAAIEDGRILGFASGVHYVHPDHPPELWINEVGVLEAYRGRGIGKRLMHALLDVARAHGCHEAWVLTDRTNVAALRLYASVSCGAAPSEAVMYTFKLE